MEGSRSVQKITDHDLGPKNLHMYLPSKFDLSDDINNASIECTVQQDCVVKLSLLLFSEPKVSEKRLHTSESDIM